MTQNGRLSWGAALLLVAAAAGCQPQLEDGYKPRALNASPAQRRAYYAPPFTPKAAAADQEGHDSGKSHRPDSY